MPDPAPDFAAAALAVAADPPPDDGRRAMPRATWVRLLRRAGWPVETREAMLPARTDDPRAGLVPKPVTVVPRAMLRDLARRLGTPWPEACRGIVTDTPEES